MDILIEKAMNEIIMDEKKFEFKEFGSELYYYNMAINHVHNSAKTNTTTTPYSLLLNVTDNKGFYIRADIKGLDRELRYHGLLGCPETSYFKTYVGNKLLLNCNINVNDINRSEHINGEATPILQGKMRRKKPTVHSKIVK